MNLKLSKIVKHFLNILKCVEKIKLLFKGNKIFKNFYEICCIITCRHRLKIKIIN